MHSFKQVSKILLAHVPVTSISLINLNRVDLTLQRDREKAQLDSAPEARDVLFIYSNWEVVMEACETTSLDGYNRLADILKNRLDAKGKENKLFTVRCENAFPEACGFLKWSGEAIPFIKGKKSFWL